MPSKFDRLRAGEVVEIEPGRKGRLNLESKTFETSDGRKMYVGDDPDFFPSDEEGLKYSQEREKLEKEIANSPFGEFGFQFGNQGLAGAAKGWVNKLIQSGDEYQRTKKVHSDVSEKISERSPWTSAGATVASFVPDIALTRGMSALKAAPILTTAHAGPRILDEPGQVAVEAGLAAGGGFLLDKATNYLGKVAARRSQSRLLPEQQRLAQGRNLAGEEATQKINLQQSQEYNALKDRVKNENAARLHQHNLEITDRQNRMIEAQNKFESAKSDRNTEIFRLKNEANVAKSQRSADASRLEAEYKAAKSAAEAETRRLQDEFKFAQSQYKESLKNLPKLQQEAQQEFSKNALRNVEQIEGAFPKNSRIITDQLGTLEFIQESINSTGFAGSREGAQASRVLKSLFPEGEILTAKELGKKYQAIEEAIQRASPEVQGILNQFKEHLGKRLPSILEDSIAYTKIMPALEKGLQTDISSILKQMPLTASRRESFSRMAQMNLKNAMREISPEKFVEKIQSGELNAFLSDRILTAEEMLGQLGMNTKMLKKQGLLDIIKNQNSIDSNHNFFLNELTKKLENRIARSEIKVMEAAKEASKKLKRDVRKTYGLAEPIEPPSPPVAPEGVEMPSAPSLQPLPEDTQIPPPPAPPQALPMPPKPGLMGEPMPPQRQVFNPEGMPELAPAQSFADTTGDFLEKDLLGGKGVMNNPFTKLAGLKYIAGKGALPIEAGYLAMKGLTSPTGAGEVARMTFKQGGIQFIDHLAQKYQTYHDGIIESPQERRSLNKEIENDSEIPLGEKALLQSKINRGKSIFERLQ